MTIVSDNLENLNLVIVNNHFLITPKIWKYTYQQLATTNNSRRKHISTKIFAGRWRFVIMSQIQKAIFPVYANTLYDNDIHTFSIIISKYIVPNISRKKHILHKQNQIHTNATCLSKVTEINNSANSPYFLILYGTTKCKLLIIYHHRMKLENHVPNYLGVSIKFWNTIQLEFKTLHCIK